MKWIPGKISWLFKFNNFFLTRKCISLSIQTLHPISRKRNRINRPVASEGQMGQSIFIEISYLRKTIHSNSKNSPRMIHPMKKNKIIVIHDWPHDLLWKPFFLRIDIFKRWLESLNIREYLENPEFWLVDTSPMFNLHKDCRHLIFINVWSRDDRCWS